MSDTPTHFNNRNSDSSNSSESQNSQAPEIKDPQSSRRSDDGSQKKENQNRKGDRSDSNRIGFDSLFGFGDGNDSGGSEDPKQGGPKPPRRISILSAVLFFVIAIFVGSSMMNMMSSQQSDTLITSEFVQAVEQGRVQNVVYNASSYTVSGTYYPAATAGSTAASAYNNAFEAINAQMESLLGSDMGVETTALEEQTLGTPRSYTATYVGQDSLMELLADYPDVQYAVELSSSLLDTLLSFLPMILLIGVMISSSCR